MQCSNYIVTILNAETAKQLFSKSCSNKNLSFQAVQFSEGKKPTCILSKQHFIVTGIFFNLLNAH